MPYNDDTTAHGEHGATSIEMAVVLPVFFLLLFGLFSLSIVFFGYGNAVFAARVGARYASLHSATSLSPCTPTVIQNLVTPYLWAAPAGGVTVSTTWNPTNTVGTTVSVSVRIVYPLGTSILSAGQVTVGSTAKRVIAR